MMNEKLLEILACPLCKSALLYDPKAQELICQVDKLAYAIKEGVPIMIADQARKLEIKP